MFKSLRQLLILALLLALPLTVVSAQDDARPIVIGNTIDGTLSEETPRASFQFAATAEQIITITLISTDFDPFLTLLDSEGQTLASNDDGAGERNSRISRFLIPESGLYTIVVQSYGAALGSTLTEDNYGAYTLTTAETTIDLIEYGMTIDGELTPDALRTYYTFRGDAGDTIIITMISTGNTWDTYLHLYPELEKDFPLVSNDDGAGNLNSLIGPYVLPEDGLYTIEATSFGNDDTGTFTLTLQRAEIISLEFGENAEGRLSGASSYLYYQFSAEQGDIIDLTVEGGAVVGTALVLNGPEGYQVAYSDSYSGADPTIRAFQIPTTGTYTILVRTLEPDSSGSVTIQFDETVLESLDRGAQTLSFSSNITRNTVTFTGNAGESVTLTFDYTNVPSSSVSITVLQSGSTLSYLSASTISDLSASLVVPSDGVVLVQVEDYSYQDSEVTVILDRNGSE